MKIIKITGENDYDALTFEFNFKPTLEIWNNIQNGIMPVHEDNPIEAEALEFGDVDPKFLAFVYDMQDYDISKTINFYVVHE